MAEAYYNKAAAITTSDSIDLPQLTEALYVGGAGVVAAVLQDNTVVNITAPAGLLLPLRLRRINATGTTATLLVAIWSV